MQVFYQENCSAHLCDSSTPAKAKTFLVWCYMSNKVRVFFYYEARSPEQSGRAKSR